MNVLSLFDGMSCGQIALERAGIKVDNYFASEIDKYAIQITQKNYPNTIQLGDVTKWQEWNLPKIDLIFGGSPCQGFSFAGDQLGFDDPRSKLFFIFEDIVKFYNPKYFLLENTRMKRQYLDVITERMGVAPIEINSSLVSAQNRNRYYWTNICGIVQPEDRGILLKDIIDSGNVDRDKSYCIDANYHKCGSQKYMLETYKSKSKSKRQIVGEHQSERRLMVREGASEFVDREKSLALGATTANHPSNYFDRSRGQIVFGFSEDNAPENKILDERFIEKLTDSCIQIGEAADLNGHDITWRKLSPIECERLQTVPDNYTEGVSNTQRYRMLGNGWTVDVIAHIFSFMDKQ